MEMQSRHVLIVDDDGWTRYALTRLFRCRNVQAAGAATIGEALASLERGPCCVILDLNLPDGGGEAVLRAVRERGLSCRVVVCTVGADARRLEEVERLRPDAVLLKPVDVEQLAEACCV
jgi:DNA-binding NarL/FixJ family response regulator